MNKSERKVWQLKTGKYVFPKQLISRIIEANWLTSKVEKFNWPIKCLKQLAVMTNVDRTLDRVCIRYGGKKYLLQNASLNVAMGVNNNS